MKKLIMIMMVCALFIPFTARADDSARPELHIPAGFIITYGSHLFWNKAIGLDNKPFAIGWGVISTVILGAAYEALGDGECSNHHLATAMGYNLLGAGIAIIPILFDNTSTDSSRKISSTGDGIRIPVSIFDK